MAKVISILFLLGAAGLIWVVWVEPYWFRLRRLTIRLKKPLPQPFTVLHISDFHFTRHKFHLGRFFDHLAKLEPDFVFVTGDLIDSAEGIEPCVHNLKKLRPKKGIYATLGNHDYRTYNSFFPWVHMFTGRDIFYKRPSHEVERLKQSLAEAGVELLLNRNIIVQLGGGEELALVGLDDPVSGRENLDEAFRSAKNGTLRFTLAHTPSIFPSLCLYHIDVAFAGHTHGGQIRLPGIGALGMAKSMCPIIDSTNEYGFYGIVSRGLGAQPVTSLRFLCRPEALLIRFEGH